MWEVVGSGLRLEIEMPRSTDRSALWPDGLDDRRRCGALCGGGDAAQAGTACARESRRRCERTLSRDVGTLPGARRAPGDPKATGAQALGSWRAGVGSLRTATPLATCVQTERLCNTWLIRC